MAIETVQYIEIYYNIQRVAMAQLTFVLSFESIRFVSEFGLALAHPHWIKSTLISTIDISFFFVKTVFFGNASSKILK